MDISAITIFYVCGIAILSIILICFFLFGAMKLIFKYVKESWWFIVAIFPTLIAMVLVFTVVYFFTPILAELGVLP